MKRAVEAEVLAAMKQALQAPAAPVAEALDGDVYANAAFAQRELEQVFRRSWIPLLREEELAKPGEYQLVDLAGVPLLVIRNDQGDLRVLHNVCRHRGAQILRDPKGCAERLHCPYHGFTYDFEGKLISQPHGNSFCPEAQVGRLALPRVESASFGGWLWACMDPGQASLTDYLGVELLDELENWPLADCRIVDVRETLEPFDWKIGVEAFLEPFHVPSIHPRTAHPLVDFRGMATRNMGEHSRMALPFRIPDAYAPTGVLGSGALAADVPVFKNLNQAQRQAHFVYLAFPATIWMLLPNHLLALRFLPAELGHCRMRYELLAAPTPSKAAEEWLAGIRPGYDALLNEDLVNLPWIHRGMSSGSLSSLQLSSYERRIVAFRQALQARLL